MTNSVFHADFHDVSRWNAPTEPSQTMVPVTAVAHDSKNVTKPSKEEKRMLFSWALGL
jgi:hypothetical protein